MDRSEHGLVDWDQLHENLRAASPIDSLRSGEEPKPTLPGEDPIDPFALTSYGERLELGGDDVTVDLLWDMVYEAKNLGHLVTGRGEGTWSFYMHPARYYSLLNGNALKHRVGEVASRIPIRTNSRLPEHEIYLLDSSTIRFDGEVVQPSKVIRAVNVGLD